MSYTYKYPRPAVTTDCVVFTQEEEPKVLLIQRGNEPYKGCWAFPGGFMNMEETAEECAVRELKEETGLTVTRIQQIGAYSKVDRDPRGRTVSIAYLAIVDAPTAYREWMTPQKPHGSRCPPCLIWLSTIRISWQMPSHYSITSENKNYQIPK